MDDRILDMSERIAALEEKAERGQIDRDKMNVTLGQMDDKLSALLNEVSGWKGKFGGVLFILSCLWAFIVALPDTIIGWFKLGGVR